jgi:aldehyde dehydrogenase (NAD+)
MTLMEIFEKQKENRWRISQSTAEERIGRLKRLKAAILASQEELKKAMWEDFQRPAAEVEVSEIFITLEEINFAIRKLKKWMKPRRTSTPLAIFGATTKIYYEAKGLVLVLAPWNYPFQLLMNPVVAALAAGNCVIAKPSEKTPATSRYIKTLIDQTFPLNEVAVVEGEATVAEELLRLPFDHIVFTGSTLIGKKIMQAAANHLTPVTLELGGKSPTLVTESADLKKAAARVVWGKFYNAGQTCIAPDYVYVHESVADDFLKEVSVQIETMYGKTPDERKSSKDYARFIDQKAFDRLESSFKQTLKEGARVVIGSEASREDRYISPTVIDQVEPFHALMKEEIFGPILPVLRYQKLEDALAHIRQGDKPLALYLFSKNNHEIRRILNETSAGGTVINHTLIHHVTPYAPFGGIGASGMGSYHGEFGFKALSHERTVMRQSFFTLSSILYPPYHRKLAHLGQIFLRFISK